MGTAVKRRRPPVGPLTMAEDDERPSPDHAVLEVENLRVSFPDPAGEVRAVDGVTFAVRRGSTLGIIGESGSGKSVTARAIMGLLPPRSARVSGAARFRGQNLVSLHPSLLRRLRGRNIAMIFQDPTRALNPTMRVGTQVSEALRVHLDLSRRAAHERAVELLKSVRIPSAAQRSEDYPHQLSGGMRQRVAIAMALACNPELLIADEPTTALDVTTQAQIMDLLRDLQSEYEMAIILISHDIRLAAEYTDDMAVMYAGQIVERASSDELFENVRMPYTRDLFDSIPRLEEEPHSLLSAIEGDPPDPGALPSGCRFAARCRHQQPRCVEEAPSLEQGAVGHAWACWYPL